MIKISVIVPLYNAESYISKCLDSLVNQTYQNMEIIVIDDASTDNSANIVKEYADKYNNIIFIQNRENKKTFETKRIGMETATGDYIGFCDSDDYHEHNSFEYMLNRIQEKDYDMVTVNSNNEDSKVEHSYYNKELFYSLINQGERYFMPISLFKKEVIKKALKDVNYNLKVAYAEDHLWRLIILYYVESSLHTTTKLYHYRDNQNSISKNKTDNDLNISRVKESSIVLEKMKEFLISKNIGDEYIQVLVNKFYNFSEKTFRFLKISTNDYLNIWYEYASDDLKKSLISFYDNEITLYKKRIAGYERKINEYEKTISIISNRVNIIDIIFSISYDKKYYYITVFGIKISIKINK